MRSSTFTLSFLASLAIAQPHRQNHQHAKHHEARDNAPVVKWVTEYEYTTEVVPVTKTIVWHCPPFHQTQLIRITVGFRRLCSTISSTRDHLKLDLECKHNEESYCAGAILPTCKWASLIFYNSLNCRVSCTSTSPGFHLFRSTYHHNHSSTSSTCQSCRNNYSSACVHLHSSSTRANHHNASSSTCCGSANCTRGLQCTFIWVELRVDRWCMFQGIYL